MSHKGICCCYHEEQDDETERREHTSRLISQYKSNKLEQNQLLDTLQVLIRIYTSDNKGQSAALLKRCRLNPNYQQIQRNDLQYYTPQLINYMVFHENMANKQLLKFIHRASESDFFFAHLVYFQLRSVSEIVHAKGSLQIKSVIEYIAQFLDDMTIYYSNMFLVATQLIEEKIERDRLNSADQSQQTFLVLKKQQGKDATQGVYKGQLKSDITHTGLQVPELREYGTMYYSGGSDIQVSADQIQLKNYRSIFSEHQSPESFEKSHISSGTQDRGFFSTIDFWQDLITISNRLHLANPKLISLRADIQRINERLPAAVYVPFVKGELRNFVVLNVVGSESRVFSTKMRAPFSLCIELYRPEFEEEERRTVDLSNPKTVQMSKLKRTEKSSSRSLSQTQSDFTGNDKLRRLTMSFQASQDEIQKDLKMFKEEDDEMQKEEDRGISICYKPPEIEKTTSENEFMLGINRPEMTSISQSNLEILQSHIITKKSDARLAPQDRDELEEQIFGESFAEQTERVREQSPFRKLKSWRLANVIVKTDDNLKQEQFALQLISQFDQIFREEGLPLKVTYYEVLSLGPACGIIEMVKDATTIDSLKKILFNTRRDLQNFSVFFAAYYHNNYADAINNYLNSLVAYCLVTYFLQVKDRHNGNILLLRDGTLMHIDFGFFLSNAPGKGIEFERKVPFKLLSEYIEVLGGVSSPAFEQFRKLFVRGFQACQKHQEKILILAKMMFTGHGTTLPCFKRGFQSLEDLEARFNPPCKNELELYVFAQQYQLPTHHNRLIDSSVDNWRARWYDKYQYYVQGIFY